MVFIFNEDENIYNGYIPDLTLYCEGETLESVYSCAEELIKYYFELAVKYDTEVPTPSPMETISEITGLSIKEISTALSKFKLSPHRLELIKTDKLTIIDDTYNASLDSVKNSLELLSKVDGRKVFIFADILELEEYGEGIHKDIGKIVLDNNLDVLITVGNLSKYTYEVVNNTKGECYYFENNDNLLKEIDNILKQDDTVLVKGSHGMKLIDVVNYLCKNK